MGQHPKPLSDPPAAMKAIEPHVPIGLALTVERLSFAEMLKLERERVEAARRDVQRAVSRFGKGD